MPPNCGTMAISSKWMALRESCESSVSPNLPQLRARGADDGRRPDAVPTMESRIRPMEQSEYEIVGRPSIG